MVNFVSTPNYDDSTCDSSPSLFSLSKPSNIFSSTILDQPFQRTKNLLLNSAQFLKLNTSNSMFEFLEPFESSHVNKTNSQCGGKITNRLITRSQPYSLSKPNSLTTNKIQAEKPTTNYNQTAILARLSSISSTFKSIFVRPKGSKHVEIDSIKKRASRLDDESAKNTAHNSFKLKLFSNNEEIENPNFTNISQHEPKSESHEMDINQKLERIISRNVLIESYTNRLIKESTDKYLTIGSPTSSSSSSASTSSVSSTKSTLSTLSTTSNLTHDSFISSRNKNKAPSETHQRAVLMTNTSQLNALIKSPCVASNRPNVSHLLHQALSSPAQAQAPKWTCMICLSKHRLDVKVCSICGSLQQQQQHQNGTKSMHSLNKVGGAKFTSDVLAASNQSLTQNTTLKSLNSNSNQHLLKTWTCTYCNYANDSLKVVCMNCRSSKQQQAQYLSSKEDSTKLNLTHQSVQTKRARKEMLNSTSTIGQKAQSNKANSTRLNTSNEENELNESVAGNRDEKNDDSFESVNRTKKSKLSNKNCDQEQVCCNCKTSIKPCSSALNSSTHTDPNLINKDQTNNELNQNQNQTQTQNQVNSTPTALSAKTSFFINSNMSNLITPTKPPNYYDNLNDPAAQKAAHKITTTTTTASDVPQPLSKLISSNKWSCSTCLAQNEESTSNCACCSTPKSAALVSNKKLEFDQTDSKSKSSKWTCSICLVSNEADKNACVCCSTSRDPSVAKSTEPSKTKFSELVAAAGSNGTSINLASSINSNISFGLKSTISQPIHFGSTTNFPFASSFSSSQPTSFGKPVESSNLTPALSFGDKPSEAPTSSSGLTFGFGSTTNSSSKPDETPKFMFNSSVKQEPASTTKSLSFGLSASQPTSNSNSTSIFGQSNTAAFKIENPFSSANKEASSAPSTANTDANKTASAPSLFKFGITSNTNSNTTAQTSSSSTPLFGASSSNGSSLFSANKQENTKTQEQSSSGFFGSGFGSSTSNNNATDKTSSTFSFGGPSTANPSSNSMFGSSSTNVFGGSSSQQNQSSAFSFGASSTSATSATSATPAASPFLFGTCSSDKSNETNKPSEPVKSSAFSFGAGSGTSSQASFNFGSSNANTNTGGSLFGNGSESCATPSRTGTMGFGVGNTTPAASSTFVFGGISAGNQPNNGDAPSLTQVLAGQSTTPSTRLIKKPTRRLKK